MTRIKNIQMVVFDRFMIRAWYYSPYPEELGSVDELFICHGCFKYTKNENDMVGHKVLLFEIYLH